jgi:hypothetical protein
MQAVWAGMLSRAGSGNGDRLGATGTGPCRHRECTPQNPLINYTLTNFCGINYEFLMAAQKVTDFIKILFWG